ncbi:MAG: hypothetical protein JO340_16090 [Acidobacteriaceae bacterium]|nr:hypothetical protein [Acidobacteriaceae bacterium]
MTRRGFMFQLAALNGTHGRKAASRSPIKALGRDGNDRGPESLQATPPADLRCTGDPFIDLVIRSMPPGYEISCSHVVTITDFSAFLRSRPDLHGRPALIEKAHRSIAFTIDSTWPIYFNAEQYRRLADAYETSHQEALIWVMVAVAGHELTHATGHPKESDGLLTELSLISRFMHEGKIGKDFPIDMDELERQFVSAVLGENGRVR